MSIDTTDAGKLNNAGVVEQDVQLGTEIKAIQDSVTGILAGTGITLPTSDPSVAGALWADSGVVTVSSG